LGMVPAEIRAAFKPGQPIQSDLSVSNEGPTELSMRTTITDLWYDEKTNEKQFPPPGSTPRSAGGWIEVVPRTFTVPARGTAKVKIIITPPLEAKGGYYAVVFVESKPELAQAQTAERQAIFANIRLGALVLLSADGTEEYKIEIGGAKLTPPAVNQDLKLEFELTNQGNTHIFPQAKLGILNDQKQLVARAENEPRRFFPGQKDTMAVTWSSTLKPGSYTALLTLLYSNKVYTQEFPFTVLETNVKAPEEK
jgi:hypothetical protein